MGLAHPQDANKQRHVPNKKGTLVLRKQWQMSTTCGEFHSDLLDVEEMPYWPVHLPWSNEFICFGFSFISSQLSTSQTAWEKEAPREEVASLLKKASVAASMRQVFMELRARGGDWCPVPQHSVEAMCPMSGSPLHQEMKQTIGKCIGWLAVGAGRL